ncbi:MAG TPA: diguanylate cyclase [Opitutaceae bacterium]|jgi:diguanylate cyclase (GGDEF)-like protein|nr:diguanylate cyclase [Opitutaceae bacterium]
MRPTFNILLVEDVPLLAKITEQMLQKSPAHRYHCVVRSTLADALVALKGVEIDLILLDLNLPDSQELDTLSQVLEAAPDIPIVVLTATQGREIGFQAIKLGAQDFLVKGDFNYLVLDRAILFGIERHRLRRTVQQLAVIDELTGLYNRRGLHTLYPDLAEKAGQAGARGYLGYFDLDKFKQINDTLGHQKGDEALVEFAGTLRKVFRKDAILVRLGGDEFVVLGIEAEPDQARQAVDGLRVVLTVRNQRDTSPYALEASAGLAYFDRSAPRALDELSAEADIALYRDKQERRAARGGAPLEAAR